MARPRDDRDAARSEKLADLGSMGRPLRGPCPGAVVRGLAPVIRRAKRYWLTIWACIVLAFLIVALYQLREAIDEQKAISSDTNRVVKREVPRLEAQVAGQTFVLTQQAVPAIIAMQAQIQELGGDPPEVLLSPGEPPFAEQPQRPGP